MLTISFSLANSQCWSCSDELPPPAELRGRAAHHHPLPGCLYLEVSWGSACWTGVCEIQGLEWGGVWGGRRAGARSLGGFLLGKTEIQLSCLLHVISLLNFKHSKHTKNCGYKRVALILIFSIFQIKDGRWHQTHFVFHSLDPTLLPVVDIYNLPKASPSSHYHLEVSPVCFLWDCVFRAKTAGTRYIRIGGEWRNLQTNQTMAKHCPSKKMPPTPKQILLRSAKLPGLQTQREQAQGPWAGAGDKEGLRKSRAVLALQPSSGSSKRIFSYTLTWRK